MRYIIIGNSAAAIGAVEGIRRNDKTGNITIISSEPYHTYSRPLISYLVMGKVKFENIKYRDENFYEVNNCETLFGKTVIKIDPSKKKVYLDDGESLGYDKLLVATGSTPVMPPVPGLAEVEKKFTFASLDDAKNLEKELSEDTRVLILGAGLIGLKCAEAICKKAKCTCIDFSSKVLSSILDDEGAAYIKDILEKHNIEFRLSRSVVEFKKDHAILNDNSRVDFDVLVLAVGVRPNVSLIKDIGGKTNRGIVINEKCETSVQDIYAAGDCCESLDVSSGEFRVMALLPNAYLQGECAGTNMTGSEYIFNKAIPMNAIGFFGTHVLTAGNYVGDVYIESNEDNYKKLYYSDNKLNGYIIIGNIERAGIYTSLIREKTPLDSIDYEEAFKKPGLIAFSREVRGMKLGGPV